MTFNAKILGFLVAATVVAACAPQSRLPKLNRDAKAGELEKAYDERAKKFEQTNGTLPGVVEGEESLQKLVEDLTSGVIGIEYANLNEEEAGKTLAVRIVKNGSGGQNPAGKQEIVLKGVMRDEKTIALDHEELKKAGRTLLLVVEDTKAGQRLGLVLETQIEGKDKKQASILILEKNARTLSLSGSPIVKEIEVPTVGAASTSEGLLSEESKSIQRLFVVETRQVFEGKQAESLASNKRCQPLPENEKLLGCLVAREFTVLGAEKELYRFEMTDVKEILKSEGSEEFGVLNQKQGSVRQFAVQKNQGGGLQIVLLATDAKLKKEGRIYLTFAEGEKSQVVEGGTATPTPVPEVEAPAAPETLIPAEALVAAEAPPAPTAASTAAPAAPTPTPEAASPAPTPMKSHGTPAPTARPIGEALIGAEIKPAQKGAIGRFFDWMGGFLND